MRTITTGFVFSLLVTGSFAQQTASQAPPPAKTFVSSAEVAALIEKAKAQRKGDQPGVSQLLLELAPYHAKLEYHVVAGPAALHEHEAEVFYVVDGAATLVTGGKLINESRIDSENLRGTAIAGGTSQSISKGDFLIVAENTPHGFSKISGSIVLMTLKVPRPLPVSR